MFFYFSLTIEDRVANSTPTALTLPNQINITEVTSVSCGDKHLMLLCADGVCIYF